MRFQSARMTVSLEPRATPTSESTQLPPPAAESTTQAATAPVFTYVTPPAPSNQSLNSIGTGNSNSGFTPPIQGGVSLGVCVVLLVAGLLAHRYNKRRLIQRSKVTQDSMSTPGDPNPSMSESPAQHMSSRQRGKMPASNDAFQATVDDDEIRPATPQRAFLAPKRGGRADQDSSSMMITPC